MGPFLAKVSTPNLKSTQEMVVIHIFQTSTGNLMFLGLDKDKHLIEGAAKGTFIRYVDIQNDEFFQ